MSIEEFVVSFLGGGLVVGLLNLWYSSRTERKRKRMEFVRAQLQELYGPLQFFTSCNAQFFKLTDKLNKAYKIEYIDKKYSEKYGTQERVGKRAEQTIELQNQYIYQVLENNKHIFDILTNHYSLIEPEDAEILALFIVDYTRHKTEIEKTGKLTTPLEIYEHLGDISFMRPEFIDAINDRFLKKKAELDNYLK